MARSFRRRRYTRRYRRSTSKRARLVRKRMMIRRKIKKFVNKMGYPSYVKMIGMTESKRLLLRKTLMLNSTYGSNDSNVNAFQILLNPLECPNINKVFTQMQFNGVNDVVKGFNRVFKYDYVRIKNIFISIKPAQSISTTNGTNNDLYGQDGDSPISNVYAYFTYKNPALSPDDNEAIIKEMYGTNPRIDRIKLEGKLKNTYCWPSNKAMTISVNKLMYRVNTEPFKICPNRPFDLQYLDSLMKNTQGVYDPFGFDTDTNKQNELEEENKEESTEEEMFGAEYHENPSDPTNSKVVELPDLQSNIYNLFFGRLVIISPKKVRFTAEICYDCVLLR